MVSEVTKAVVTIIRLKVPTGVRVVTDVKVGVLLPHAIGAATEA